MQHQLQRLAVDLLTLERAAGKAVDGDEDQKRHDDQREQDQRQSLRDVDQSSPGQHLLLLRPRGRRKAPGSVPGALYSGCGGNLSVREDLDPVPVVVECGVRTGSADIRLNQEVAYRVVQRDVDDVALKDLPE